MKTVQGIGFKILKNICKILRNHESGAGDWIYNIEQYLQNIEES